MRDLAPFVSDLLSGPTGSHLYRALLPPSHPDHFALDAHDLRTLIEGEIEGDNDNPIEDAEGVTLSIPSHKPVFLNSSPPPRLPMPPLGRLLWSVLSRPYTALALFLPSTSAWRLLCCSCSESRISRTLMPARSLRQKPTTSSHTFAQLPTSQSLCLLTCLATPPHLLLLCPYLLPHLPRPTWLCLLTSMTLCGWFSPQPLPLRLPLRWSRLLLPPLLLPLPRLPSAKGKAASRPPPSLLQCPLPHHRWQFTLHGPLPPRTPTWLPRLPLCQNRVPGPTPHCRLRQGPAL